MKGIILAGGSGTRLYPLTRYTNKHLLPIYYNPMVFYPLSVLMLAGIKEILIISTPQALPTFENLLGNGSQYGISLSYAEQQSPDGIAQAFIIGEEFIGKDTCVLILGDNIFYGNDLRKFLRKAVINEGRATVFGVYVDDPERYGVAEFDENGKIISLDEKPMKPKSNYAITGLYFYDHRVVEYAKLLKPSKRGELEITDLNRIYLEKGKLDVTLLEGGCGWLDIGTMDTLLKATDFVKAAEKKLGLGIFAPEEIAYFNKWISIEELNNFTMNYRK